MSTNDVPGAKAQNRDVLAMGCWAEHEDGSLIHVEANEAGTVVYSMFDLIDPPVEYRDAMPEAGFKKQYSWDPKAKDLSALKWTWHDKTPFPWDRIMGTFPAGTKHVSAREAMTAAKRVAESLDLRAQAVQERHGLFPSMQRAAKSIAAGIAGAVSELKS